VGGDRGDIKDRFIDSPTPECALGKILLSRKIKLFTRFNNGGQKKKFTYLSMK